MRRQNCLKRRESAFEQFLPAVPAVAAISATTTTATAPTTAATVPSSTATSASMASASSAIPAATASAPTSATTALCLGTCFIYDEVPPAEILAVQGIDRAFCVFVSIHFDERETTRLSRKTVTNQIYA